MHALENLSVPIQTIPAIQMRKGNAKPNRPCGKFLFIQNVSHGPFSSQKNFKIPSKTEQHSYSSIIGQGL